MQYLSKKTTLLVSFVGSVICSLIGFFILLAGSFYRIFYKTAGPFFYWVAGILLSLTIISVKPELALLVFSMWATVGFYSEVERRGKASFGAAIGVVLLCAFSASLGLWFILQYQNLDFSSATAKVFDFLVTQQNQKLPEGFPVEKIGTVIPGIITIFLGMILGFGLMIEKKIARLLNLKFDLIASHLKLHSLVIPDFLIWPLILSFAASFAPIGEVANVVGLNIFIVTAFVYWFQGLAVVEFLFKNFQIGPFMRIIFYALIVLQIPFILSAIGILDFWLNFRKKLKKTKIRTTTQNGENL